ncbi:MAG: tRNA (adenosine(37)-N6)-threonylcarbamoyltransferase complex dimerization subunit type 1 TsaB [Gammaproteobacteria bacterium]|nr:tRNA (adenosine(37)-N6)-threonylcarbamoyltransferase complex dimerization subunit type 1 TsaB [Gammaproteobacteria bacterium]
MKIVALDTSTNACSVTLLEGNQQDFSCIERFEIVPRQHTQLILPMLDSVLQTSGYQIKDIDVLAFGHGPGAFTGIRVATGVIQGISYGADLPVASISSLAALAQAAYHKNTSCHKILVANDARMNEIYFAAYEIQQGFMTLIGTECVIKPDDLEASLNDLKLDNSWQLVGNGWSVYKETLTSINNQCMGMLADDLIYPNARDIAYLAFKEINNQTLLNAEQISPVYLRNNIAQKSNKK